MHNESYTRNRRQQDQHLDHLNNQVIYTGQGQRNIAQQLEEQKALVEGFHHEIDYTTERMNTVQKKLAQLLETRDTEKICSLLIMVGFTIALVLMIIIL